MLHNVSYTEMSDVRSMNRDTKFDADVNFDEKRTSQDSQHTLVARMSMLQMG